MKDPIIINLNATSVYYYSEEELENHADLFDKDNWEEISEYATELSYKFIDGFSEQLDWYTISYCSDLPEDFIRKYREKLDWEVICANQALSEKFIDDFKEIILWEDISCNNEISEKIIINNLDKIHYHSLILTRVDSEKMSDFLIEEITKREDFWEHQAISSTLGLLLANYKTPESLLRERVEFFKKSHWAYISQRQNISVDFITKYKDKIDFRFLSMSESLTFDKIFAFQKELEPYFVYITENQSMELKDFFTKVLVEKLASMSRP